MTLRDLATDEEVKEVEAALHGKLFSAPNHNPACTHNHLVLKYAFRMMGDLSWHVISHAPSKRNPAYSFKQSTLSMLGLKEWGLL